MRAALRNAAPALLCVVLTACSDIAEPNAVDAPAPQFSAAPVTVSGSVVFTNGRNICNYFPTGFTHSLRIIRVVEGGQDVSVATPAMTCPVNTFAVNLEPGEYIVRGFSDMNVDPTSRFPRLPLSRLTVAGPMSDVAITYAVGGRIRGSARLDGEPLEGILVSFKPTITDANFNFSSFALTRADGGYAESANGVPPAIRDVAYLQPGIEYTATCGTRAGTLRQTPPTTFTFPDVSTFNCRYRTSAAAGWTHTATDLKLTAGPGYFGMEEFEGGAGYGVQYPTLTTSLTGWGQHMFDAGFLIATDGVVLSTFDHLGHMPCGATCRDLQPTSTRPRLATSGESRQVTWTMTDAASAEAKGVRFQQQSFDGTGGAYVLFRLALRNTSTEERTFDLGFFADWDLNGGTSNTTGVNGDVAYVTRNGGAAPPAFMGSVFLGDYPARSYLGYANTPTSAPLLPSQLDILNGTLANTGGTSGDVKYIQSVPGVQLRAGRTRIYWFAIVAGATQAEMLANAAAAEADMNARIGAGG